MELTEGRHFSEYGASMDNVLSNKAADILPWLVPGLTVDRGCGTGALMGYLATRGYKVVGVEISSEMSAAHAGVVAADVSDQVFCDGFVSNIILSSVLHEVYSYKGYSLYAVAACIAACAKELRKGGRIIIRDIWSPEPGALNDLVLKMDQKTADKLRSYEKLTPANRDRDNDLFPYIWLSPVEAEISIRLAVEFLSKKEYDQHWELECREIYTGVPMLEMSRIAAANGLKVLQAKPILNEWIMENRWRIGAELRWRDGNPKKLFTNQLVVLEKR